MKPAKSGRSSNFFFPSIFEESHFPMLLGANCRNRFSFYPRELIVILTFVFPVRISFCNRGAKLLLSLRRVLGYIISFEQLIMFTLQ